MRGFSDAVVDRRRSLISTGAAAAVAGCHSATILRAIERGELEAVRLGRRGDHRVYVDARNEWLRPAATDNEERTL
jgi:excisionase family DNA binding protein